jgi:hypothetical protein
MVAVNGDPYITASNNGIWALYLVHSNMGLEFKGNNKIQMHGPACNTRASGSAYAGPRGELVLYCHQKGERATQFVDAISCAEDSVVPYASAFIPLSTLTGASNASSSQQSTPIPGAVTFGLISWAKGVAHKIEKLGKKVIDVIGDSGAAEATALALGGAALGDFVTTASVAAGSAAATGSAVLGTGLATGGAVIGMAGAVATNFGLNTLFSPNGACMRAVSADTRIYYTEIWPVGYGDDEAAAGDTSSDTTPTTPQSGRMVAGPMKCVVCTTRKASVWNAPRRVLSVTTEY